MLKYKSKLTESLQLLFPGAKIYLFGSRARGDNFPASDIDIALDAGSKIDPQKMLAAAAYIDALNIPYEVGLVDFNAVPQAMRDNILKEGILWND